MSVGKYMKSQAGAIALMAIFLVFFISALMITLEIMRRSDLEIVANQIRDLEAYYCAESGIEQFMNVLRTDPTTLSFSAYDTDDGSGGWDPCIENKSKGVEYKSDRYLKIFADNAKADPNYTYYHYITITSSGKSKDYTRRVKITFRRPQYSVGNNLTHQFITRWREL